MITEQHLEVTTNLMPKLMITTVIMKQKKILGSVLIAPVNLLKRSYKCMMVGATTVVPV